MHLFYVEILGKKLHDSCSERRIVRLINEGDASIFRVDRFLARSQLVEIEDILCELACFNPIASSRYEDKHGNRANGNMRNTQEAIFFPGVNDSGGDIGGVELVGEPYETLYVSKRKVGFDVISKCIDNAGDCEWIEEYLERERLFLESCKNSLLAFGASEVSFRITVSFADVFECGCAVEVLPSFLDGECFITVIWSGKARIEEIAFDIDADAANAIDNIDKSVIVERGKCVYGKSGYC